MTSHDVVSRCRKLLNTRKVGHAGTLDPMATGVLILGVERATKLLGLLALTTKSYSATIRLGQATTTDDAEGEVLTTADASAVTDEQIAAEIAKLTGDIQQVPASVSAIKVDGQRAHALIRAGEEVTLAARPVTVSRFDVLARRDVPGDSGGFVDLDVDVDCSSGTYIRALARDLGAALGVGGHLTALRRTSVGPFTLEHARTLEQFNRGPCRQPRHRPGRPDRVPAPADQRRGGRVDQSGTLARADRPQGDLRRHRPEWPHDRTHPGAR